MEPPSFHQTVWPRLESAGLDRLVLRHDRGEQKRSWIQWRVPIDGNAEWSALRWNDLSAQVQRALQDGTGDHLSIFFRQDIATASLLLELYRDWPATVFQDVTLFAADRHEQELLASLLGHATADGLLMSFHSERKYVVWFGDPGVIARLHQHHAPALR